ncbi:hypothetical protein BC835DRAFT_860437 [Cytidiella melzeri]|nr:hypothetical protein BC835DRAFT_860437 [Cytidiella melzeri]
MFAQAVTMYAALVLVALPSVLGTLYSTTCSGGKPCSVDWLDNGESPTLSTIGPCYVGLYHGNGVLVQQIEPVDVANVHSLTFTPDSAAGPNSNTYYINFTTIDVSNPYTQYSPFFTLNGMSGSLSSPNPSDTSSISVPSTVASAATPSVSVTITVNATQTTVVSSTSSSSGSATSQTSSVIIASSSSLTIPSITATSTTSSSSPSPFSSASFTTIRTSSSPSLSPPSGTTLSIPASSVVTGASLSASSSGTSVLSGSTVPSESAQTSGAAGARHGQSVGTLGACVAVGVVAMVMAWM